MPPRWRRSPRSTPSCCELAGAVFLRDDDPSSNPIIALLATFVVVLLSRPVKNAIQTGARPRLLPRSLRLPPRAGRLRARPEQRSRSPAAERAAGAPRHRDAGRRSHGADAGAGLGRRDGDFVTIAHAGFPGDAAAAVAAPPRSATRLMPGHTLALDDPLALRRLDMREVDFWREAGIHYFVPCVSKEGTIAVMALGRKASAEPLSSEDMALLSAVAAQAATALENGRLYRQLRTKADELERMRAVQREHPGVAERRPRGRRPQRPRRPLEPPAGRALRRPPRGRGRPARSTTLFDAGIRRDDSRLRAARVAEGAARLPRPDVDAARAAAAAAGQPRRRRRCATRTRAVVGSDRHRRGHLDARAARGAAADLGEDGVDRPARRRRGARGQHAADRHLELHADAAARARSRTIRRRRCSRRSSVRRSGRRRSSTAC